MGQIFVEDRVPLIWKPEGGGDCYMPHEDNETLKQTVLGKDVEEEEKWQLQP